MEASPNVVLITTHDINPHLGCYTGQYPGAEWFHTPNLDALAQEGCRFDNAFATHPICAPSRSAMMTGCFPTSIGTAQMRSKAVLPPGVRLFSEYLRQQGYYATNNWFTDFQVHTPVSAFDECSPGAHWRHRDRPDRPFFAAFHSLITHESQIYLSDEEFAQRTEHVSQAHRPDTAPLPPTHPDTPAFRTAWARYADLIEEMDHWVGQILGELEEDGLADSTIVIFCSDHGAGFPRFKRWPYDSGLHVPLLVRWPGVIEPGSVHEDLVYLMDIAPSVLTACGVEVPESMQATSFFDSLGHLQPDTHRYLFGGRDRQGDSFDTSRTVRDKRFRYIRHLHPDRSPMQHNTYPDQTPPWQDLRRLRTYELNVQIARGERPDVLTQVQRSLLAPSKPVEELYDLLADPYETMNLASLPQYADQCDAMRAALDQWTNDYGDLGVIPEEELMERWRPGGRVPECAPPHYWRTADDELHTSTQTPGACVVWTVDPAQQVEQMPDHASKEMGSPGGAIGAPVSDGRHWRIACEAWPIPTDVPVWLRTCRAGFEDSAEVLVLPA